MTTKTNLKSGATSLQHNETIVRDSGKNLKVKTQLRAGHKMK